MNPGWPTLRALPLAQEWSMLRGATRQGWTGQARIGCIELQNQSWASSDDEVATFKVGSSSLSANLPSSGLRARV